MRQWIYLLGAMLLLTSCVTSVGDGVSVNDTVVQDDEYNAVLERYSKNAKVFVDFEARYTIDATMLATHFRSALASRYERLFKVPQPMLSVASDKAGFFISLFSPEMRGYDLEDETTWSVLLDINGKLVKPSLVKRLPNKERWTPFMPSVNQWSKEYLLVFDEPLPDVSNEELLKKNTIALSISNADAQVKLGW